MTRRLAVLVAVAVVLLAVAVALPHLVGGHATTDDTAVPLAPAATRSAPIATTSTTVAVSLRDPFAPLVNETPATPEPPPVPAGLFAVAPPAANAPAVAAEPSPDPAP